MQLACRYDALSSNPCRETSRLSTKPKKPPTSLSVDEIRTLRKSLAEDHQAIEADVVDLVTLLMASGVRLGEALSLRWSDVDLESGTIEVKGTVLRIRGQGLIITSRRSRRPADGSSSCRPGPQICFVDATRPISATTYFPHLGRALFAIAATQAGRYDGRSLEQGSQNSAVTHSGRVWPL